MKTKAQLHQVTLKRGLAPIKKVSVSEWADRYRVLSAGNAEPGRWRTSRVPYMKEVMDAFTDKDVEKVVVKSAAQVGKALALDTPIATTVGWSTMGALKFGDRVFDELGRPCNVIGVSKVFSDHECFELTFSDGAKITADADHQWQMESDGETKLLTTKELLGLKNCYLPYVPFRKFEVIDIPLNDPYDLIPNGFYTKRICRFIERQKPICRRLKAIRAVDSVPTKCIAVDSPSHLFLAGEGLIPTHNSEVLLNVTGRYSHVDPATMMIIQPTLEMATDFSKSRLSKLISDTRVLTRLFYGAKDVGDTRNANQTLLSKFYVGGRVVLAGANSPAGLASRPIRILLCDEIDRFPPSAGAEGDPLSIAARRTTTYWNRKIGLFSTPTVEGISRIDIEYMLGTRERWAHECPNCGEYHTVDHRDITDDCKWLCPDCGFKFDELTIKNAAQKYVADNPGVEGVRSFFITGFYSPWLKWTEIMREWEEARGKPELEKVVYNTRFGLSYEHRGDISDDAGLVKRVEQYDCEIPTGVLILTAGVDVQANRLEYEICGWGVGEECWGICRGQVFGSPQAQETWQQLDAVLDREYATKEGRLKVFRTFIDSGFLTSVVYEYCSTRLTNGRMPIKGYGLPGKALVYRTQMKHGLPLTILGVNEGKSMIYDRLMLKDGEHRFHFGKDDGWLQRRYDEAYFKQLLAERRVIKRTGGMLYETYEPVSKRQRNEALDLRVYALAAMKSLNIDWAAFGRKEERPTKARKKSRSLDIWQT